MALDQTTAAKQQLKELQPQQPQPPPRISLRQCDHSLRDQSHTFLTEHVGCNRWTPATEPDCDRLEALGKELERAWCEQIEREGRERASLSRAIFKCFGHSFMLCAFWEIVSKCLFGISMAIVLGLFIGTLQGYVFDMPTDTKQGVFRDAEQPISLAEPLMTVANSTAKQNCSKEPAKSWSWHSSESQVLLKSILLIVSLCGNVVASQYYLFHTTYIGMKCRLACTYLIYRKAVTPPSTPPPPPPPPPHVLQPLSNNGNQ